MALTELQKAQFNVLGNDRWNAIKRLKEACAVVTLENDLEDVVVALAHTVIEKDDTFQEFCSDIADDMECTCGQHNDDSTEKEEEKQKILEEI